MNNDSFHGDEGLVDCKGDCSYYCECDKNCDDDEFRLAPTNEKEEDEQSVSRETIAGEDEDDCDPRYVRTLYFEPVAYSSEAIALERARIIHDELISDGRLKPPTHLCDEQSVSRETIEGDDALSSAVNKITNLSLQAIREFLAEEEQIVSRETTAADAADAADKIRVNEAAYDKLWRSLAPNEQWYQSDPDDEKWRLSLRSPDFDE